jgi:hypothetical protein
MRLLLLSRPPLQTLATAIVGWRVLRPAAIAAGVLLSIPGAQSESPVDTVLRSRAPNCNEPASILDRSRPQPPTPEFKARVLDSLRLTCCEIKKLGRPTREKLASLERVLQVHQRQTIYEFKVVQASQARVGLYLRLVVLISEPAMNVLDSEELQAAVAHEIGHEYVWTEYQVAEANKDYDPSRG